MTPEQQKAIAIARARRRRAEATGGDDFKARVDAARAGEKPSAAAVDRARQADTVALAGMRPQSNLESFRLGDVQGFTLGSADEMSGFGGDIARDRFRAADQAAREQNPVAYAAGRVTGTVMSPVTRLMPNKTSIPGAAVTAGGVGFVEGVNEATGGARERVESGIKSGAVSTLFGGLTAGLFKGASYGLKRAFQVADERPTVDTLKTAKNVAYAAVRRSGQKFSADDTRKLFTKVSRIGQTADFQLDKLSDTDKAAFDALRKLQLRADKPISLNNLDKVRQSLWTVYNKSDHPFVLRAIGEIDDLIASKAQGNEIMQAARLANSKYAKAQLLENAFRKAELQTASTGSGGNILNKYRQAVTRIITTPREAKWFSPEEITLMENFVKGDTAENVLRRVGKLSPGGNGLMTALNVYAASVEPTMLAVTGAATAAKGAADRSAMRGSERILDAVSGYSPRPGVPLQGAAIAGGAAANRGFDD